MTLWKDQTQGPEFLIQLIRAHLDPGQEPPPMPPGKPPPQGTIPREMGQLRRQMADRLSERIADKFNETMYFRFTMTEAQLQTIQTLDIPEERLQNIQSLNCLQMLPQNHAINRRLEVIAAIPPTRNGEPANWKDWWLQNRDQRIGVARPQDHDPNRDPISEELNQVIQTITAKALQDQPSRTEIAQDILEKIQEKKAGHQSIISLTQVWAAIRKIQKLAERMGAGPRQVRAQDPESAEQLLKELREAGFTVLPDMGSIGTPWEIRDALLAAGHSASTWDITTSCTGRRWYWSEAQDSNQIDPMHATSGDGKKVREPGVREPGEGISSQERALLARTAPEHPGILGDIGASPNPSAATIAFLNRMTPQDVVAIIDQGSTAPQSTPPRCPRTQECNSWCAHLQETGILPFPLTHDGIYRNCQYWQFLERFGNIEPAARGPHAQQACEQAAKTAVREYRQENRAAQAEPPPKPQSNQAKLF